MRGLGSDSHLFSFVVLSNKSILILCQVAKEQRLCLRQEQEALPPRNEAIYSIHK